jgi:N,N-dimethylformamidase
MGRGFGYIVRIFRPGSWWELLQMDIQAYFEEWSRQPGDVVRLAISTPHRSVRASLVRLVSGPGHGDHVEGRVADFSSVLDKTISGRLQPTMVGSYAEFPLPAPIKNGAISVHCWAARRLRRSGRSAT